MNGIFRYQFHVPAAAIDANGHANNVEYVRWMQEAATSHADAVGCTTATQAHGATWVVRSHRIEYYRPALAGDLVLVRTWVTDFRKVMSLRKYEFVHAADETMLAAGETDWVYIDSTTGRPRRIPSDIQSMFVLRS